MDQKLTSLPFQDKFSLYTFHDYCHYAEFSDPENDKDEG